MYKDSLLFYPLLIALTLATINLVQPKEQKELGTSNPADIGHIATIDGEEIKVQEPGHQKVKNRFYLPHNLSHKSRLWTNHKTKTKINLINNWTIEVLENSELEILSWKLENKDEDTIILNFKKGHYQVITPGQEDKLIVLYNGRKYKVGQRFSTQKSITSIALDKIRNSSQKDLSKTPTLAENEPLKDIQKSKLDKIEVSVFKKKYLFEKCLANRIRDNESVSGRIMVGFNVISNGDLENVKIIENQTSDKKIEDCLINAFGRIKINNYTGRKAFFAFPLDFK